VLAEPGKVVLTEPGGIFSGALGRIHPAAGSWSTRRLATLPSCGGIVIHPGRLQAARVGCAARNSSWSLSPEPPMGGMIEEHAGCRGNLGTGGRLTRTRPVGRGRRRDAGTSRGEPSFAESVTDSLAA